MGIFLFIACSEIFLYLRLCSIVYALLMPLSLSIEKFWYYEVSMIFLGFSSSLLIENYDRSFTSFWTSLFIIYPGIYISYLCDKDHPVQSYYNLENNLLFLYVLLYLYSNDGQARWRSVFLKAFQEKKLN